MPRNRLSLAEVLELERRAWVASTGDEPDFFFDGIVFWHLHPDGSRHAALPPELPQEGWWHREDCPCVICRARAGST